MDHLLRVPILFISEHRPGDHGDLASQRDSRFLLASLLFATDPLVDTFGPRVVPQRGPSTFDQDRTCERIATLGDASVAIGFARLVLPRDETEVGRDLASVFKAMWIVNAGNQYLGGPWSDAGNRLQTDDSRVSPADRFEPLNNDAHLLDQRIENGQLDVELALPEFSVGAVDQRHAKRVDMLAAGVPGLVSCVDRDALVDEPSSDRVFAFVDASVERLAIFDERAELAMFGRWHGNRLEFAHRRHASKLQGIVFVGLAFHVGPPPRLLVGRADECLMSLILCQIIDPTGGAAGLHDDQIGLGVL